MSEIATSSEPAELSKGSPPRPEGEKHIGHAGTIGEVGPTETGEASPVALALRARKRAHSTTVPPGTDDGAAGSLDDTIKITRATGKLAIEPWRLAEDSKAHAEKKCGGAEKCRACALLWALKDLQRASAWASNVAVNRLWLADMASLEIAKAKAKAENRRLRGVDWKMSDLNLYAIVREAAPELVPASAATLSSRIFKKWAQSRWNAFVKMSDRPPYFRASMPLPLRADNVRIVRIASEEDVYRWSFSLHGGRHPGGEYVLPIFARDEYQSRTLRELMSKDTKIGDASIQRDRKRPSRWYVRFSYTKRVAAPAAGGVLAGINRGIVCFLAGVTSTKQSWIYDGDDIVAYLAQIQRRRQRFQRQIKASERVGHGRVRALKPIEHLEAKAERWRQTRCQVIARRFVRWLVDRGVNRLYIEDFSGIRDAPADSLSVAAKELIWQMVQEWPYYQLQTRIESCCAESSIEVVQLPPKKKIAQTCPNCGNVDKANMDLVHRTFRCTKCKFRRHLDVATAINVIRFGERGGDEADGGGGSGGVGGGGK